ncbi:hypothetical protein RGUI_2640 [Rhodovulum sp. P5]|uniref:hypothetical protein n=1 Tax=Rhodovulum sp. P5 TaxID=1564506 RepID=UPI0009C36349|nr:hypothetical protein [Rhodovulum sp. P5]ARE40781.1 hypothetical protein RGUI_2640 [Rhodovulum sp. P5]
MALHFTHIDETRAKGVIDDVHAFDIVTNDGGATGQIHTWKKVLADRAVDTVADMRSLTYELVAFYRNEQRSRYIAARPFSGR